MDGGWFGPNGQLPGNGVLTSNYVVAPVVQVCTNLVNTNWFPVSPITNVLSGSCPVANPSTNGLTGGIVGTKTQGDYWQYKWDPTGTTNFTNFYLASADRMLASRPDLDATGLRHCATLLVNGQQDDVAPVEDVEPVFAAIPGEKRWIVVPGADHNALDADPGLGLALRHVTEWFADRL